MRVALVTPFGNLIYRLAYESLADASVLVLLIVASGMTGMTGCGFRPPAARPGTSVVTVTATATATGSGSSAGTHTASFTLTITQ